MAEKPGPVENLVNALGKRTLRVSIGFLISGFCLWMMLSRVDLADIAHKVQQVEIRWILLSVLSLACGYLLRVTRWQTMLRAFKPDIRWSQCVGPYLASIALNNCLPLRAGDVVRAFLFPRKLGIESSASLNTLLLERILDMIVLGLFALSGLWQLSAWTAPWARSVFAVLIAGSLILPFVLLLDDYLRRMAVWVAKRIKGSAGLMSFLIKMLDNLSPLIKPALLLKLFALTLGIWIFEMGLFHFILVGIDENISLPSLMFIVAATTLSTLVPSTPGYVGTFHMVAFMSAKLVGVDEENAALLSILAHAVLWLATTIPGLIALLLQPWDIKTDGTE